MQRTVPHTSSDPIALLMRTYYSLLRTTEAVPIHSLVESYFAMNSSLHIHGRDKKADPSALTYTGLRLPKCIVDVETILLGQTVDVFEKHGYDVGEWQQVSAPGRRRRMHWDGDKRLAVFLSSRSDIDDLLPMLIAYQIEWNKIYDLLWHSEVNDLLDRNLDVQIAEKEDVKPLAKELGVRTSELRRLGRAFGDDLLPTFKRMSQHRKNLKIMQLAGSLSDYRRATSRWWRNVRDNGEDHGFDLEQRPVYFVSSNLHALSNLFSGFAVRERDEVLDFLHEAGQHDLLEEYNTITRDDILATNEPNFLYYASKKYLAGRSQAAERKLKAEQEIEMLSVEAQRGFDVGAQLFKVNSLQESLLDPRLADLQDLEQLQYSDAIIMNIDYPLGLSAYELLSYVSSRVGRLAGVYIMGKAATLNGRVGDVMVPNVVHDEHSSNTYLFSNCFSGRDISPYMAVGSVLDNQKAITAFGTFLQNSEYMNVFYEEGYTVLEMEAGPYLSAIYENVRPRRHPSDEIVRLYEANLDVGIIHYASDTPFSKGHNLGAGSLGFQGVESTYAAAIAITKRIFEMEIARLRRPDRSVTRLLQERF